MNPLITYTDYRKYLRDAFQETKRTDPSFSLRSLSEKAGFKARDFILRVMNGERNVSKDACARLSAALGHNETQDRYFHLLVAFNQAKSTDDKERLFRRLSEIRKHGAVQKLRDDQFEFLSTWYHAALRSLLPVIEFDDDFEKLGKRLQPSISARQARMSVNLLVRLGLLEKQADGNYTAPSNELTTGNEVRSLGMAKFHRSTMDLAKDAIDRVDGELRDISGVTMSISPRAFSEIKREVQEFRRKIMGIASRDSNEDRVYQLNMQLFPLTKTRRHDAK